MAARKKPTKAEVKAKKVKRQSSAAGAAKKVSAKTPAKSAKSAQKAMREPTPKKPNATKKILHVCGGVGAESRLHKAFKTPEWQEVRLDPDPALNPDIEGSITDLSNVPDSSMDAVFSIHGLVKIHSHELVPAIQEWKRVLKEGGAVVASVPDAEKVAALVATDRSLEILYQTPIGPVTAIDILYGHRRLLAKGEKDIAHKNCFTATVLGEFFRDMGFSHIAVSRDGFNLWVKANKMSHDNPNRLERVTVEPLEKSEIDGVPVVAVGAFDGNRHPGHVEGGLTDELDQLPRNWTSLTLT